MTHTERAATPAILPDRTGVASLMAGIRGVVFRPGDEGYDEARKVWNGMIDRHPALIVRCAETADVIACVNLAREEELPLAIRGGGHNVAGSAVCDDGVVVDLTAMKGIEVDPEGQTVHARPGLLWGELDRETQVFGLATNRHAYGDRGAHPRWRHRLAHAPARAHLRQSCRCRRRAGRRTISSCQ
jgi:hypothetical protein